MDGTQGLEQAFADHDKAVRAALEKSAASDQGLSGRLTEIEQRMARGGGGGTPDTTAESWGQQVARSDAVKGLNSAWKGRTRIAVKAILTSSTANAAGAAGGLLQADRPAGVIGMAQRALRVRSLFAPGTTNANSIEWPAQTGRINNAAAVAEGALKPQSDYQFELKTWPVRTLAHWVVASKQILDDVPALMSIIDQELVFGVKDVEDSQLLNGSGSGADLLGIAVNATPYVEAFDLGPMATQIDVLLAAIAQVETLSYLADGIVLNPLDWRLIQSLKDTEGRYIGGGPFTTEQIARLWALPVATTTGIASGSFLVGAFQQGAQLFDRQEVVVEVSTESGDSFIRNLCVIRAEERLALVIKHQDAFVKGTFAAALA